MLPVPPLLLIGFLPTHELNWCLPYLMPLLFAVGRVAVVLLAVVLVLILLEIAVDMPPNLLDIVPNQHYSCEIVALLPDKTFACLLD